MSLDKILKDFKENKIDEEETIAALNKHFDVCFCELGDVYRNRRNGKLIMVLRIDEDKDIHFINEDGQSDYESIHRFEEYYENENRNVREHWESFVNSLKTLNQHICFDATLEEELEDINRIKGLFGEEMGWGNKE